MSRPLVALLAALMAVHLVACDARPPQRDSEITVSTDSVTIGEVIAAYRPTLLDTIALGFPKSLAVHGDSLVVVDRDQLVSVLDRDFELLGRWSRRGEGPGEVSNPLSVARDGSRWVVGDGGNLRFQWFDDEGAPVSSYRAQVNMVQATPVPAGMLVHGRGSTYVDLVPEDGSSRPWGPPISPRDTSRIEREMSSLDKHFLARFDQGAVILDGETADLFVVDLEGTVRAQWHLPEDLRGAVFAETGVSEDDTFGVRAMAYRPAFVDIDVESRGEWAVLIPGRTNPLGPSPIFVDLSDGSWHPSRVEISSDDWENHNDVFSVTLEADRMHMITGPWDGSILTVSVQLPPTG